MSSLDLIPNRDVLCIVPARMGSTRLKHKNIQELTPGCSLVHQALNTARGFTCCISTDEPSFFSEYEDALVIKRPADISDSNSNVSHAISHAHQFAEHFYGRRFEIIVTLMPAIAARSSSILLDMLLAFISANEFSSAITCSHSHPWLWKIKDSHCQNSWHPNPQLNSQELPDYLIEHNSIIINKRSVVVDGCKWQLPLMIYSLPTWSVALDIDDIHDLTHARALYPSMEPLLTDWKGKVYAVRSCNPIQSDK